MQSEAVQRGGLFRHVLFPLVLGAGALGLAVAGAVITGARTGVVTGGVESLSASSSNLLSGVGAFLPLGFAFGAGMVAAVNPCGFAMLPAYVGLYLGSDAGEQERSPAGRLARALVVSGVMTAGFILLFGVVGLAISGGARPLARFFPWIGLAVGVLLAGAGAWMIGSRGTLYSGAAERLSVRMGNPGQRNLRGYFAFGLGYGTASLSCTLPIFLTVVGSTLTAGNFATSLSQFVLYGLGMGVIIVAITLAIAIFRGAAVGKIRRVLPYVQPVSAALLLVAGGYIVYYWLTLGGLIGTLL